MLSRRRCENVSSLVMIHTPPVVRASIGSSSRATETIDRVLLDLRAGEWDLYACFLSSSPLASLRIVDGGPLTNKRRIKAG